MRLIKVCLEKDTPFWFFNSIQLTPKNRVSEFFNIDILDQKEKDQLNADIKNQIIRAFDKDSFRIINLSEHNLIGGELPFNNITEDIEINEKDLPEIVSVTCSEEEAEVKEILVTQEDIEEAKIILSKNGNTARKIILNFEISDSSVGILKACLELESENKNRASIIKALNSKMEEE